MAPVHEAFARLWPEAECTDLLDTALSTDRERDGDECFERVAFRRGDCRRGERKHERAGDRRRDIGLGHGVLLSP